MKEEAGRLKSEGNGGVQGGNDRGTGCDSDGKGRPEIEVVLLPGGDAVFSWNTPEIQEMAVALGLPEFDRPRWCG